MLAYSAALMKPKPLLKESLRTLAVLVFMSLAYGYHDSTFMGPYSHHVYRQSDCLAYTLNYYQGSGDFFHPELLWIGGQGHGRIVSEFPVLYYTVAQLWKVFGQHHFIYRFLVLLILFYGLLMLFRLAREFLGDSFWALMIVVFLFTSKILAYYGNNFLTDVPALALAMAAAWYYFRYFKQDRIVWLYVSMSLFLLAGLLKISALMLFFGIGAIHVWLVFFQRDKRKNLLTLIPFAMVIVVTAGWYAYARHYSQDNAGMFLQGILPIWELDGTAIKALIISFYQHILPSFMNISGLFLLLFLFMYNILYWKQANPFFLALSILLAFGSIVFVILFFQVFDVHDYYLTNLLINIPLILLTFIDLFKRQHPNALSDRRLKLLATIGIILLMYGTASITRLKYDSRDILARASFFTDEKSQGFYNWYHWNYGVTLKGLEGISPWLEEVGVGSDSRVVSLPDFGINNTLYLMERKGYTDFGYNDLTEGARMERFIMGGAEFLVVNDTNVYSARPWMRPYLQDKIGQRGNVEVFRLHTIAADTAMSVH